MKKLFTKYALFGHFQEQLFRFLSGDGAVADLIFDIGGYFRHCFTEFRQIKNRVVAETICTGCFNGNRSFAFAVAELHGAVGFGNGITQ